MADNQGALDRQKLLDSGMPPTQVDTWETQQRTALTKSGMPPDKISTYFGDTTPDFTTLDQVVEGQIAAPGADIASNPWENVVAGFQMSSSALPFGRPQTVQPEKAGLMEKVLYGAGQTTGDIPAMVVGAFGGGSAGTAVAPGVGTLIGAGVGGAALPTAIREVMIDQYTHPDGVRTKDDFLARVGTVTWNTTKAAIVGAITAPIGGKVGQLVGEATGSAIAGATANVTSMAVSTTAASSALEGRMPSADDFVVGAVLAVGFSAAVHVGVSGAKELTPQGAQVKANLEDIYYKTGLTPEEVMKKAETDPAIRAEVVAPRTAEGGFVMPELQKYANALGRKDPVEKPWNAGTPPKVEPAKPFSEETRGGGVQFHGSGNPDLQVSNDFYTTKNYYGQGFYTTDAQSIAYGYSRKGAKGPDDRSVYQVTENRPLNIYDAEQPIGELGAALKARIGENPGEVDGLVLDVLEGAYGDPPKNLRELYDEVRVESSGADMSADTVQEAFDGINGLLREQGYDGLSHTGGLRTNNEPHKVVVYFNPEQDVTLSRKTDTPAAAEPAKAPYLKADDVPPVHLELFRALENSADDAVSPAGAIGRYQIMPDTAKMYGFDPQRLQDPVYNEQVARAVIADLNNKFDGNFADMAVGYNAGPGRARAWIKGGRVFSSLPLETQKYLLRAAKMGAFEGKAPTDYSYDYIHEDAAHTYEYQGQPVDFVPEQGNGGGGKKPPLEGDILAPEPGPKKIETDVGALTDDALESQVREIIAEPTKRNWLDPLRQLMRVTDLALEPARKADKMMKSDRKEMTVEDQLRQTFGSYGRAGLFFREGVVDLSFDAQGNPVWKSTNRSSRLSAFRKVKEKGGTQEGFMAYRLAKRAVEKAGQNIETGVDLAAARELVSRKAIIDKYEAGAAIIRDNKNGAIEYLMRSGVLSEGRAAAAILANEEHIVFRRVIDPSYTPPNLPGGGVKPRNPLKEMTGSKRQIVDPETADVDNQITQIAMADRNIALTRVVDMVSDFNAKNPDKTMGLEKDEGATELIVRDLDTGKILKAELLDEQGNVIPEAAKEGLAPYMVVKALAGRLGPDHFVIFRDGQPEVWKATDPAMADILRLAAPGKGDPATNLLTWFADLQRKGIVMDPFFGFRTMTYGQFTASAFAEGGPLVPFSVFVHAALDATVGGGKAWREWEANGGKGAALADIGERYVKYDIGKAFETSGAANAVINFARDPLEALRLINSNVHAAAQVGFSIQAKQKGYSPAKAAMLGRAAYLDNAEHFALDTVHWWSRMAPFIQPTIQGFQQTLGAAISRPGSTALRAFLVIGVPTIANYMANMAIDQTLPEKDRYHNRPRWARDLYWSLPPINGGPAIQIKKPPDLGTFVFSVMLERFMDNLFYDNKHAFDDMQGAFQSMVVPPVLPTLVTPIVEGVTNYSFMTNRPIVPVSLQDNSGWMQYGPNTSETAKSVAQILGPRSPFPQNVSPLILENFVTGWTGTVPLKVLKMLEAPFDPIQHASEAADLPFLGSFFVRHSDAGQILDDFYDEYGKAAMARSDLLLAIKRGNVGEIALASKAAAFIKVYKAREAVSNLTAVIRGVDGNPDMTADEKRLQTDQLASALYEVAKTGLLTLRAIGD